MITETERLELVLLSIEQLRLWIEDIQAFEKELNCIYRGEPLEGFMTEIIKKQYEIAKKDLHNYLWNSFFVFKRKKDNVIVGSADFKTSPNENGEVEIGYGLGKDFEHQGYMTEAVKGMCQWALNQHEVKNVIAETEVDNLPSQNVLKRCGFKIYLEKETLWWIL